MTKEQLRKKYKKLRATLSETEREEASIAIANQSLQLDIWHYNYYHIFLPIEKHNEVNTAYLLSVLSGKDKNILVPKSDFRDTSMKSILLLDNTKFIKTEYGITEPTEGIEIASDKIAVVFVPLLGYDLQGNRVGYGKGFYDRFLSSCKADVLKIGLSFFDPEENIKDKEDSDIALDYCITSKRIWKFSST